MSLPDAAIPGSVLAELSNVESWHRPILSGNGPAPRMIARGWGLARIPPAVALWVRGSAQLGRGP